MSLQIDVRRLKIQYSDAEGLPVAFLFHKKLLKRSLKKFAASEGFTLFCKEKTDGVVDENRAETSEQRKLSEEDIENEWNKLSPDEKEQYAQREKSQSIARSRRSHYRMLAYREELLRWLVDLIRSPLPSDAVHWYVNVTKVLHYKLYFIIVSRCCNHRTYPPLVYLHA